MSENYCHICGNVTSNLSVIDKMHLCFTCYKEYVEKHKKSYCFIFHDWNKWEKLGKGKTRTMNNEEIGLFVVQERRCKRCGYTQMKTEKLLFY